MTTMLSASHSNEKKQEFDYVIVGAGASAMGLVYGLLSHYKKDRPPFTIAVLERGDGPPHSSLSKLPNQWCNASHTKSCSVELQDSLITGNRVVDIPVGKGIGGSTNVNACLCTPPSRDDFASWPTPWNQSIMRSVAIIQDEMIANNALYIHHADENPCESNSFTDFEKKTNHPKRETVFPSLVTHIPLSVAKENDGTFVRRNYYEALVEPILRDFPDLTDFVTFLKDFEVQRLLFDQHDLKVVGVEGQSHQQAVYARREVILCAGAIESPALLLVSGIGHELDLKQIGVRPKRKGARAGVGRQLRDHVLVPRVFLSPWAPRILSPNGVYALCHVRKNNHRFQFILNDAAVYSQLVPHFVASFVRRRISHPPIIKSMVNFCLTALFRGLRSFLVLLVKYTPLYFILRYFVITLNIALLNPVSAGTVSIRLLARDSTKDEPLRRQNVQVIIEAGYLNNPEDVAALWEGWNASSQRFETFLRQCLEVLPGFLLRGFSVFKPVTADSSWFSAFALHLALPYFHWCGSCSMKTEGNDEWVVDSSLSVRNAIPGLRVCDASVFPTLISGPPALTCAALGHAFAGILLNTNEKKAM